MPKTQYKLSGRRPTAKNIQSPNVKLEKPSLQPKLLLNPVQQPLQQPNEIEEVVERMTRQRRSTVMHKSL